MPYSAEISRHSPAAFLFLLDQSASMQDPFGGAEQKGDAAPSKARVLSDVVNKLLRNLVLRCAKDDGIRDYFHVGIIGYGAKVQPLVQPSSSLGTPADLIAISHIAERPLRIIRRQQPVSAGARPGRVREVKIPVWFEPLARNGTPMCEALDLATSMVRRWISQHPEAFPPVVVNITDGEATDGDPLHYAQVLRGFASEDGPALLFNVHLSSTEAPALSLPDGSMGLPNALAVQLFQMSSPLPFSLREAARQMGQEASQDARGFIFNADPDVLVQFLEIGTRPGPLR